MFGLIGGAISSAIGAHSQKKTNETNMRIAQMNNEWSERMQQKQMDYNTAQWMRESQFSEKQARDANAFTEKMWNKTNEYNSAQAQAERLRAAGLNPALVMSGQNAGTAQGASGLQATTPSGNSIGLPSPSSATVQPYDVSAIALGANGIAQRLIQQDMNDAQIRLLDKQTAWYDMKALSEFSETVERSNNWRLKNIGQNIENTWLDSLNSAEYYKRIRQGWSEEANAQLRLKQSLILDKDIAYYDARAQGELSEQLSRIALNYANKELSLQQANSAFQDVWNKIEQRIGMKIDNDIKAHTRDVTIQRAHDAQNLYQLGQDAMRGINRFGNDVQNWFEKNIIKKSKRAWKDTRRAFGIY